MADKIKDFFKKKKSDIKFKKAGPGYRLNDTTSASNKPVDSGKTEVFQRGEQTEAEKQAAAAALARFGGSSQKNSREVTFNRSHAAIQAQVRKEMEKEKQELLRQQQSASSSPQVTRRDPVNVDAPPLLAVNGVYFKCPLISDEVLSKEDWLAKIRDFLYSSLEEDEKGLTSCLMIRTLNKNTEKVEQCIETLSKYINNILQNPTEEKYHKIRTTNKVYLEKVKPIEGTFEFLEACGFSQQEMDGDTYLVYNKENCPMGLDVLLDALNNCESIKLEVDRNIKVLTINSMRNTASIELPPDFFYVSPDELKKEQKQRQDKMELELTLRTKAMREKDSLMKEIRNYKYCIIRIKFPDSYILQGTFSVYDKYKSIQEFVQENILPEFESFTLSISGIKFVHENEEQTLQELKLVPASLLTFHSDHTVKEETEGAKYLKPEIALLLQD